MLYYYKFNFHGFKNLNLICVEDYAKFLAKFRMAKILTKAKCVH